MESSRVQTLDIRQADFDLFRTQEGGILWEAALTSKGAQASWQRWLGNTGTSRLSSNANEQHTGGGSRDRLQWKKFRDAVWAWH